MSKTEKTNATGEIKHIIGMPPHKLIAKFFAANASLVGTTTYDIDSESIAGRNVVLFPEESIIPVLLQINKITHNDFLDFKSQIFSNQRTNNIATAKNYLLNSDISWNDNNTNIRRVIHNYGVIPVYLSDLTVRANDFDGVVRDLRVGVVPHFEDPLAKNSKKALKNQRPQAEILCDELCLTRGYAIELKRAVDKFFEDIGMHFYTALYESNHEQIMDRMVDIRGILGGSLNAKTKHFKKCLRRASGKKFKVNQKQKNYLTYGKTEAQITKDVVRENIGIILYTEILCFYINKTLCNYFKLYNINHQEIGALDSHMKFLSKLTEEYSVTHGYIAKCIESYPGLRIVYEQISSPDTVFINWDAFEGPNWLRFIIEMNERILLAKREGIDFRNLNVFLSRKHESKADLSATTKLLSINADQTNLFNICVYDKNYHEGGAFEKEIEHLIWACHSLLAHIDPPTLTERDVIDHILWIAKELELALSLCRKQNCSIIRPKDVDEVFIVNVLSKYNDLPLFNKPLGRPTFNKRHKALCDFASGYTHIGRLDPACGEDLDNLLTKVIDFLSKQQILYCIGFFLSWFTLFKPITKQFLQEYYLMEENGLSTIQLKKKIRRLTKNNSTTINNNINDFPIVIGDEKLTIVTIRDGDSNKKDEKASAKYYFKNMHYILGKIFPCYEERQIETIKDGICNRIANLKPEGRF